MGHVYATLAELKSYIVDGGSYGTANDGLLLGGLDAVSRLIDAKCERSGFGSGFGPRTGTNQYDGCGENSLRLRDDLLTASAVTIRLATGASSSQSAALTTDYYLLNANREYGTGPYRRILLHRQGISAFGSGLRVTDVAGSWGYQDVRVTSTATVNEALDTSETGVDVTDGTVFSPGHTILVDSEQMYVSGVATNTLTVVRGANGTTAATHNTSAGIGVYQYPAQVKEVCIRLTLRRWKARDGGADGLDGGLDMAAMTPREGEETILRRGLFGLRLKEMV